MERPISKCSSGMSSPLFTPFLLFPQNVCRVCQAGTFIVAAQGIGTSAYRVARVAQSVVSLSLAFPEHQPHLTYDSFPLPSLHKIPQVKTRLHATRQEKNKSPSSSGAFASSSSETLSLPRLSKGYKDSCLPLQTGASHLKCEERERKGKKSDRCLSCSRNGQPSPGSARICGWIPEEGGSVEEKETVQAVARPQPASASLSHAPTCIEKPADCITAATHWSRKIS
ncbi:hypothetical protein B0T16DRAFT_418832 [Cercophora newfieldiana]|uniref:Uncharacterized protein n=1 Tax=Cercophora newfieldiana TaxID=92897 RepID=A0AA39XVD9_9PEZI|nr:hypothetical protein B0T16DRAFT_418832 [Cercophora newfieldiana]